MGFVQNGLSFDDSLDVTTMDDFDDGKDNRFLEFSVETDFWREVAKSVLETLKLNKETINIALSGGSLEVLYKYLAINHPNEFRRVNFWQVDEKAVDENDFRSNQKLIRENLLNRIGERAYKSFHYFDTTFEEEWDSVGKYESELFLHLEQSGEHKKFDLVILGVGNDGHTGSIFPNSEVIEENEYLAVSTYDEKSDVPTRFTITFPIIMESDKILVFMKGRNKQTAFNELQNSSKTVKEFPALKLTEHANAQFFFGNFG